jgi:hypothetical protein
MPAATPAHAPRKRGRPPLASLTLDEVADALAWPAVALERLLCKCPELLPGAVEGPDGWSVPERALRDLLGARTGALPPMASVADVAAFLGRSERQVYRLLHLRDPHTGRALLPARRILGEYRVAVADVLKLPPAYPDWAPARPAASSFFSANQSPPVEDEI